MIFWTKFAWSKTEKMNITILSTKFQLKTDNFDFSDQIYPKRVSLVKSKKSERHPWILYIWVNRDTKFHLKLARLLFLTKFTQKGYFRLKTENRIAIFYFLLLNRRDQFLVVSQSMYECNIKFGNRCFFKDKNFYEHEFFRIVSDSWFRVTFIFGSENHISHDNFSFIFSISIKLFL